MKKAFENKEENNKILDKTINEYTDDELRAMVELLLGRRNLQGDIETKVIINNNKETANLIRTVELDILLITEKMVNIEVENNMNSLEELTMRARYYNSMVTSKYGLKTNQKFCELKPLLTVFIVTKRFKEDKRLRAVILPEQNPTNYLDNKERTVFLSTYDINSIQSIDSYDRLVETIGADTDEYGLILSLVIELMSNKDSSNLDTVMELIDPIFIDKLDILNKGVGRMNYVKKAYIEAELVTKIKVYKLEFDLTLNDVIVRLKDEDKEKVTEIYNSLQKED